jgi:hypothetical protein
MYLLSKTLVGSVILALVEADLKVPDLRTIVSLSLQLISLVLIQAHHVVNSESPNQPSIRVVKLGVTTLAESSWLRRFAFLPIIQDASHVLGAHEAKAGV